MKLKHVFQYIILLILACTLAYVSASNYEVDKVTNAFNEEIERVTQDYENKLDELNLKVQGLLMENSELIAQYSYMDNRCFETEGLYERRIFFNDIPDFTQMSKEELIEYVSNLSQLINDLDKTNITGEFREEIISVLNNATDVLNTVE